MHTTRSDAEVKSGGPSIESFYHLGTTLGRHCCQGLACFAARRSNLARWQSGTSDAARVYCLGKCYVGPASTDDDARPHIESRARATVLLENALAGGAHALAAYHGRGGGEAIQRSLQHRPQHIVDQIAASGLRGRGGAGFPAGRKWAAVAQARAATKYVVVNADEGDPGSFSDRMLLEDDPFLLIEGMSIAAYAVGARRGYIYLRKEYPLAAERLRAALGEAYAADLLGKNALGPASSFDVELVVGRGSYLCGEETAMLNAIEGKRPDARTRPPFTFEHGLHGAPTLVNNVETLCAVPWIVKHGAEAYAALGFAQSRGTKLVSLSSTFRRPGLYEIEFGVSLRDIVEDIGGGLNDRRLQALMIGGPLAGLIPPRLLETKFGYEELQAIGAAVGHGGVIAFGTDTAIAEIAHEVFRFGAFESCGKCVPCHRGSPVAEHAFAAAMRGRPQIAADAYARIIAALEAASLCGHGRGLAEFARNLERHFPEELAACFA